MQKTVILKQGADPSTSTDDFINIVMLNDLLSQGWFIVQTCPMPSAAHKFGEIRPTCLIVLGKEG